MKPIYHCSIKIGGRSKGKSAIVAAAYRAGEKLYDNEVGKFSDYTKKSGIVHSEISLCENAPFEYKNRETLWNAVHKIEKARNAQLWREVEVALPRELGRATQTEIVREYVRAFTDAGMCADWSIHDTNGKNPHAHIMLTTRPIKPDGSWGDKERKDYALDEHGKRMPLTYKNTNVQKVDGRNRKQWIRVYVQVNDWNNKEKAKEWRKLWADVCNKYLSAENKIDHRSLFEQGIDRKPTIHEGYIARKMEKSGNISERCEYNRLIRKLNAVKEQIALVTSEIKQKTSDALDSVTRTVVPTTPQPSQASPNGAVAQFDFLDTSDDYEKRRIAEIDKRLEQLNAGRSMAIIIINEPNSAKEISALLAEKKALLNPNKKQNTNRDIGRLER